MRMATSDTDLAIAAAGGDRGAFSALLERHYDRIFAFGYRITGSRETAEDLAQDICSALPAKLRGFRGEAAFSTWLYRVVLNAAHDRRRRNQTHAKAAEGWAAWEINRRAASDAEAERLIWLRNAMATLPEDLRDTLALITEGELTQAEAATVLGLSEGTIAWRISEIKKRLRALSEQETGA